MRAARRRSARAMPDALRRCPPENSWRVAVEEVLAQGDGLEDLVRLRLLPRAAAVHPVQQLTAAPP